jgi:hypothetical protein
VGTLAFKPAAGEILGRLGALYQRKALDRIFASFELHTPALDRFAADYREPFCPYPDPGERIHFWHDHLAALAEVEDDTIPSAYLSEFDQGLYGALAGGDVRFLADPDTGWISSMVPPLLSNFEEFDTLSFDLSSPWFHTYLRQMRVFVEGAAGKFGISHFILIDSLNFIYELVGATHTYTLLEDDPERVRRAIDFAFELNLAVQNAFFDNVPLFRGGTCSNMTQWMPGRVVSESVDPFHMTSVRYFEKWGREPVERMFSRFDGGGVLHIHGNGRHLLEAVSSVRGLQALYLGDDKGYPPAIEVLPALRARVGDMPLILAVDYPVFLDKLERGQLPGGVFYKVRGAPHAAAANRTMERVRAYRV